MLATITRRYPEARTDAGLIGNLIYEMHITWADLSGLVQWLLRMLADHPLWLARLRAAPPPDPEDAEHASLAARVVSETLRLQQVEHLYRTAERDLAHEGKVIPRGWLVRICLWESHRDPDVFPDPDAFDPDRFLGRTYTRREFLPFGAGRHACIGEALARTVGRLFVEALADGWEWRTVADGPIEQGSWRHWRPSSRWRIAIAARTRSGRAGIASIHTPVAAWMAAVIAGTTGIMVISPMPRAPNGPAGSAASIAMVSIAGTASSAVGRPQRVEAEARSACRRRTAQRSCSA